MQENFPNQNNEEELRDENAFLKMKLMLEHGASMSENENEELPPDIENMFLQNVIAFEKQWEEKKQIKIYDKIGRPIHFKPQDQIPEVEIDKAWEELRGYLNSYGIDLDACSPNISNRELYRFTIEELFNLETDDISLPGWINHFIYDEFYPDPVYDNTRSALDNGVRMLLSKQPLEWLYGFRNRELYLNGKGPLASDDFKKIINRFKECYEELELMENKEIDCLVDGTHCTVTGNYKLIAKLANETIQFSGSWEVRSEKNTEFGYWDITGVQIENIPF